MSIECKKCGYTRKPHDAAPDYECPSCGAVYAKVEARLAQQREAISVKEEEEKDEHATEEMDDRAGHNAQEDSVSAVYTMKGVQDILEVFEDRVTITPKGVLAFFNKGLKGSKEIPFRSIVAVQFKEAGALLSGYIQFTIPGGNESRGGLNAAVRDENTFMFAEKKNNPIALEIKSFINSARKRLEEPSGHSTSNLSDEIMKLAELKQSGILTDEEFQAAKKKLIS